MYTVEMLPEDPVKKHFRLNDIQLRGLKKLGLETMRDLLYHFPARYEEAGAETSITGLVAGVSVTVYGTIGKLEVRRSWKRKIPVGEAVITDATGSIKVMWFHQPYMAKKFSAGMYVKAVGVVSGKSGKPYLANPQVTAADPTEAGLFASPSSSKLKAKSYFPVYPESRGITSLWFRHALEKVFPIGRAQETIPDPIPKDIVDRYNLPDLKSALVYIHKPDERSHAEAARKRFAFEEIFAIQLARAQERAENNTQVSFPILEGERLAEKFQRSITFTPTSAQQRAIADILTDFEKPHPMARLLEGDVGSGKTYVAAATAYAVVQSRPPRRESGTLQVAYMAPTEILANQHFQSFIEYFKELPINIALITGSGCKKFPSKVVKDGATDISRAQLLKWIANGEIAMLVGTHALIQKSVKFQHLAYAIVDEQHRFGTRQRRALAHKGDAAPHFLSMTATPIPRTLSLTLYGDLDLSILDELPPGRAKITTTIVKPDGRAAAYEHVREQLKAGRQAFVICPRIEEPDPDKWNALQAKSAKAEAKRLAKDVFPEFKVGLLHGAVGAKEKDMVMSAFAAHKIDILVATSVVEVGINVPNATVMMIEGAERFGLAQLHQLRGRIMRSSYKPFCFLLTESKSEVSIKRLKALAETADGFKLAEADLEARGAGDLLGRKQWGVTDLGMKALKNVKLIRAARLEAQHLIEEDAKLSKYPALAARIASSRELHQE
ncbi:ATP-dependent DNA helicase RecG [Candidatus Kaiserbacteria bacterium CG10_big_fil_rev_8_21_14_0_10_49_17]|uniref:Probable DNA 3'-5' helicase RecG n=1 Tax=Candidatus Kaiserbacteria bacterium CG10_big_fil_rev_8_21_14_0_10_49_17 TaxID=1974609 RepID=A0A2M6WEH7_9BACT|nr:MAG: ATP-dependent DNA helicase RecG [Candidatus Kaiserbacteria bacterium CG10_big_fil_rev_8_21_14_0_10_49_17]